MPIARVRLVFLTVVAVFACGAHARLAPHELAVGVGVGMPDVVKNKYHTTDAIFQQLADLEKSCSVLTKHEVEAVDPKNNLPRKTVAYTLTDPNTPKESKKRFMLTFGMHGREYISSETALHLAKSTCGITSGAAAATASTAAKKGSAALSQQSLLETSSGLQSKLDAARVHKILQTSEIAFIPILNQDGRRKVEQGASCTDQRKNGRNVDINRNFADWFDPSHTRAQDEDYPGPGAMSEWESNVVKTLGAQFKPHAFIDIHSGELGMGYVWGHSGREKSPHEKLNHDWASYVSEQAFDKKVWTGNLANMGAMPYESHGSSCDYMYKTQGARISGTWEIWRKPSFFASTNHVGVSVSGANNNNNNMKQQPQYDYISTNVVPVATILDKQASKLASSPNALQVEASTPDVPAAKDELQSLVQSAMTSEMGNDDLGLNRDELHSLVQTMKEEGKDSQEIQTLLQEMSREQCFAYFNPVMPEHYDNTVSSFASAILLGAEHLGAPELSSSFN